MCQRAERGRGYGIEPGQRVKTQDEFGETEAVPVSSYAKPEEVIALLGFSLIRARAAVSKHQSHRELAGMPVLGLVVRRSLWRRRGGRTAG